MLKKIFAIFLIMLGTCFLVVGFLRANELILPLWYWLIPTFLIGSGTSIIILREGE
jgi:hypothetical protein